MIYFIQPIGGGPVKIGFSDNVPVRHYQLESYYGLPLATLATVEGDEAAEREWHRRFAHLRLGRTEQFRPAPELLAAIGLPLLASPNPDAVEAMEPAPPGSLGVKLPADVMKSARIVATLTGETIGDVLGNILRPALAKREREEMAKRAKQVGGEK